MPLPQTDRAGPHNYESANGGLPGFAPSPSEFGTTVKLVQCFIKVGSIVNTT